MSTKEAEADAISDLPGADPVPERVDDTDDLVAGHNRLAGVGTHALNSEYVAVANTAALNFDPDMTGIGRGQLAVHHLKLSLSSHLERTVSRHFVLLLSK
jgi:hypothetical protein